MNRENVETIYRLSPVQQGMVFHTLYSPGEGVYFEQFNIRFGAGFQPAAFARVWRTVIEKNPILRTSFVWEGLEEPVQVVHRQVDLPFEVLDWRGFSEEEKAAGLQERIAAERRRGFDLAEAPLVRFIVVRLRDDAYHVIWCYHHLILDGWSAGQVMQEVSSLYAAVAGGHEPQAQQRRPFRDYIAWLRQQDLGQAEAYWRRVLGGFTTPTPLGVDRPAGRNREEAGRDMRVGLVPEAETEALKAWARESRLTVSTVVQGAWALVLSRYSGEEDLVYGLTVSGRPPSLAGVESMLGCFINTLPVRVRVPGGERARTWLQGLQADQTELRRYEQSPLVQVLGWSDVPRPTPLFESIFVFEGLMETAREGVFQRTGYPLTLVAGPDRELVLRIDYERERFAPEAIERLLGHLRSALSAFVAGPEQRLEEVDVLQPAEREQLLSEWNRPGVAFESPLCLHEAFAAQAARTPGAPAVTFEGESRSYGELDARANRVAHRLRRLGVGPESRVGLCVDRSFELVEGLLGILKAGGAYVPLDPRYPASRLSYIAEDSRIRVVVTTEDLRDLVPGVEAVCLGDLDGESAERPVSGAGPDNLAYVIYTSGSTGKPKGSLITHRNVARLLAATQEWFHFGPQDVWSLFHSFAFDFSVWEIWGALLYGGRLVVVPYWVSRSPEAFHELLVREKVTVLNQTPSAFRQLVQADGERGGELALRYVVFGGEALELSSLGPWFDRHGDEKPLLVNMYGITETTVHVTYRVVRREDLAAVGKSPVGVPIPDLAVHLRDRHGNLVPVGVAGEMYVAGAGVARGYLGRPELTAERFVPDPFGGAGERLYRSGDLARWLEGGDLEYLGRIDHQVKIRGFRIELGEIEAVLGSHPAVREAVVLPREEESGDRRLVGYVVSREGGLDTADLRAFLKDRLPDYMVPSALVEIPAVPLTAHGKVDRKALPDPSETVAPAESGFDPPRTPTEELVAGIWSEVLRVERVGREDSFFDLGGHSLLATRVLSRLREVLQVDLPLRVLFEAPTVAELAPRIEAARAMGGLELPPLVRSSRDGDLPLSFSQERLWFLEQLQPGTAVYHIPNAVRMTGTLDVEALRRSLAEVVRRHEALRTVFAARGGRPVQMIREDLQPAVPLMDLSSLPDRKAEIRRLSAVISRRPFDLGAGPLLRPALLKLGADEHVLLLTFHHIVSDAWSLEVLLRELAALYTAFVQGRPSPLPELPVQYADFALWQRSWLHGEALEAQLAYWRERLAGVPVLQLPGDRPRPAIQSYQGAMVGFALPEPLSAAVHAFAKAKGATVFMVLLAAYEALLSRATGQEDFAVGSPVAGRDRREIEGLIGFFVNTLVLRSSLAGDPDAVKLLDRVRALSLEAYAHQSVPFERIVQELAPERNLSYSPLFQVMLAFQSLGAESLELPGLILAPQSDEFPVSKFDLTLTAFDSGAQVFGQWVYSTALFERETVERWSSHFQVLLEGLVAGPARRVSELPLLTAAEREQILIEWNRPPVDYPEEGFVHQLFEAQVERTPEAEAVVFEGESLTYRELDARANRLARHLRKLGAGPEVLVGIQAERSFEMVVGLLAILKAGSAYLPLDPSLPEERLSYMMEDAGIELVVTQDLPDCREEPAERLAVPVLPENPAYVIYTSGSTGQPKGVVVSHRALGNRLQYARAGDVLASDAFLQKTTISFDVSLLEIFAPLVIGGRTVLARPGGQQDPEYLVRLIQEERITYTSFPPSLLLALLEQGSFDRCDSVRVVITGGETVPAVLPGQLYARLPNASLLNRYGPTEATISVTSWLCEREGAARTLPIGTPTAKARVYLLDAGFQPVPVGITGEIFLGGICVARGYLRRPELTAERFVPDPFGGEAGERLYRTGDLARHRPDGAIEFVGRVDQQVKIRGFRVELGEIEAALARHPAVQEVAVIDRADGPAKSLAAYLVLQPGEVPGGGELRGFLLESLPAYMVPADFVVLDALPLSPTGKVDRKALPAPGRAADAVEFAPPEGPVEEILAAIYADVLGLERVGRTGDFFELGGHSLLATQVAARVREALGVDLALRQIFESPAVAGLAGQIQEAQRQAQGPAPPLIVRISREGELPLSFAQERLWFLDRLQPGTSTYNLPMAVRLHGRLSVPAFAAGLREVVRRHESLRTTFALRGDHPVQRIAPALDLPVPLVDLGGLPAAVREEETVRLANQEQRRPFDLAKGPLVRALLIRMGGEEHFAVATMHHIVSDGWSIGVLIPEVAALYGAARSRLPSPLPELPLQYADFARWQRDWMRGEVLEAATVYWRERLAGAPPLLELPTDRPRPAVQRFRGRSLQQRFSEELSRSLRAFYRKAGATPFMALLMGLQALLHRYTGRRDVIVGVPVAGRTRLETEGLVGFFLNSLVMRTDLGGDPDVAALLERTRETALEAYAHQDLPFEKLVEALSPERNLSYAPLFQVMLVFQNTPRQLLEPHGVTFTPVELEVDTAKFDLTLNARESEAGFVLNWMYNRDLFDDATVARLSGHLETLLVAVVADPTVRLSELPLLTGEEARQLLGWNDTAVPYPAAEVCLHELIAAQVERTPEAIAVSCAEESLTYRELDRAANRLAHRLRALGVGPEVPVGVFAERSLEMVTALLGVLKAGGAYLPVDPDYPADRVAYMLEDSRVPVVLTQEHLLEKLPETGARTVLLSEAAGGDSSNPATGVHPGHLAYVIYTSGSTGRPKGTMNSHRGIVNRLLWMQQEYGLTPADRVLQKTPFSFDVSVWEFFWPLLTGARLVMARPGGHQDAGYLVRTINAEAITTMHFVPSMLQVFLEAPEVESCVSLARVMASGEALPYELQRRFYARLGATLHNLYGPTEAAVDVTYWACEREGRRALVPIGRPVANTRIQLLDASLRPVPMGIPGELYIGGLQVGRGYLGRPELTAERFVPDPFSPEPGTRLYRTGDLARYLADGAIDFLGRIDHQVKLRGLRIELGEIEAAIAAHPAVREAVVLVRSEGGALGAVNLVAYVTKSGESAPDPAELRSLLARSLPDYMVPAAWVALGELPLSPNGKVDRKALSRIAPERLAGEATERVAPRTEPERALVGLWSETLGLAAESFGVHESFFDLGGNSITGAILINRLQQILGEIVHVVAIFDAPTVAALADRLGRDYPQAVVRIWGAGSLGEAVAVVEGSARPVDEERWAEAQALIRTLPAATLAPEKNPPAVFVLSPPRSGSTLLRVMLGGHPSLFAPPELELLNFNTLAERREAFPGRDSFRLEGLLRAVMEVQGTGPEEARERVERFTGEGMTTQELYRRLQEWIRPRLLVDKTPTYAWDPATLQRAEEAFDGARYLHLVRHPYGMISSFEEARIDQIFFSLDHPFSRRELAEALWGIAHRNVLDFLSRVPAERQLTVRFEDLLRDPERELQRICGWLGLEYHPDMAEPYKPKSERMTDGLYAESRMLGDVKFHAHQAVDRDIAESWRERYSRDFLGDVTWRLAARLGYDVETERVGAGWTAITRASWREGEPLPLSFSQERFWFFEQMEPGSATYHLPAGFRLLGPLDVEALRGSLREIVRRHATLRTTYGFAGGRPVQTVQPSADIPMPLVDLTAVPANRREPLASALAGEVLRRPFDLAAGPVLRAALLRVAPAEHVVLFVVHHIASDGWSADLLIRELAAFYGAALERRPAGLPELPIQYVDYAIWQRRWLQGERLEEEIGFWKRMLGGAPTLELPTDRPRPPVQTYRGGAVPVLLPNELISPLAEIGRREGATPYMFLLAGYAVLLARYSGQEDISIGSPLANRTRVETEPVIGVFANSLVLRTDLTGAPGFREILHRVRRTALAAYAHQEIPFEKIVEELNPQRDLSRAPLFQVLLALQNVRRVSLALPGLTVAPLQGVETTVAKFDLTLWLSETASGVAGSLDFNRDLFDEATAARIEGHLRTLLAGAVARPDQPFSELPLLTPEELAQLAVENSTAAPFSESLCAHQLFEAWVERAPDAVAAVFGDEELTYGELNRRANRLAHHLRSLGVGVEDRVGFCLDRSPLLWVAVLAVMKAGGTYVPLDPKHPRERLAHVLGDCGAAVLLTESGTAGSLEGLLPAETAVVLLDRETPETAAAPEENPAPPAGSTEWLAYIIYTSGSTGRPKGVQVPHRALVNFLESMARRPGLAPDDRLLAITTLSFDMAVPEVLLPLVTGARLVIAPADAVVDGRALAELLEASRATVLQATPTTWRLLMETGWKGSPGLRGWIGAEAVPREVADRLLDRGVDLWTFYGPTETTVWSTCTRVERSAGPVPLGTAFANTQIHVLDRAFQWLPAGAPGELYIGGAGVTRGYFGQPAMTAERYLPDPFAAEPGARLYRTGDLVRRRADGVLEFLGRADFQVKIRGFRIELGEIEEALARSPRVRQAVMLARVADGAAGAQLAAYVVPAPGDAPTLTELREFLAASLPDYMLPSALAVLDAFPLTPNGKIDRRALAQIAPERRAVAERAAPRTPLEGFLAELWSEALGLDAASFGVHDNFFELGGSSITGAILVNRLQETLRESLRVVALFNAPTVAGLAAHIADGYPGAVARIWGAGALETGSGGERTSPAWMAIEPGGWREGEPLPLSFSQERLWFFEQMEPGSPVYHIPVVFRLAGRLDAAALEASLGEVARRHAALRTTFSLSDAQPVQIVSPPAPLGLPVLDLGALPRERRETAARSLAAGLMLQPFDLGSGPMLRAALLRLAPEEHVAVFVVHHIVSDGWSMRVLLREVAALYGALAQGRPSPLPDLPIQYPDYALWQRRWLSDERLEDEISFWRRTLSGAPVLELPVDHSRPPVQTYLGSQEPLFLPADLVRSVKGLGLAEGSTLFMTLLAGLTALLARYSGQEDVSVGSPVANRERVQTEPLIGFFVNTLVFRTGLSGAGGFRELLGRVRHTALAAYAHQELPFERVVEEVNPPRDLSRSPLFQVMLAPQNTGGDQVLELPGLTLLPLDGVEKTIAKYDLTFWVREAAEGVGGSLEYNRDLFEAATVSRMIGHLRSLLAEAATAPERPWTELPLLTAAEREEMARLNATAAPFPAETPVHRLFEEQAARTPERTAVVFDGESLTYRELNERANRLAHALRALVIGAEERVGICVERSLEMVVAVLGVLKSGGTYVPLDPSHPRERLVNVLEDAGARVLLTQRSVAERLPELLASVERRVRLDADWPEISRYPAEDPEDLALPGSRLAYTIYTSGSTGRPKGVQIPHRALVNFLVSMRERPGLRADDVVLAVTTLSFDIAGLELLLPLVSGARVIVAPPEAVGDGAALADLLKMSGATVMQATPVTWRLLLESGWEGKAGLRVLCGGEALPRDLAERLLARTGELWNMYGPTETTVWSTVERVGSGTGPVPLGGPIASTQIHLLDRNDQPVPAGVVGELLIGGEGVARGYLGRPGLTAERFVPDPFSAEPGARLYRTGDLVRQRADGALEILGRADFQVKIRGFRIELGEIEDTLVKHPEIRQAVILAREDAPGDRRLVAYVVPRAGDGADSLVSFDPAGPRSLLRERLPEYMVPSVWVVLAELPLTPNGKVDRKALPAPEGARLGRAFDFVPPRTEEERVVAALWSEALRLERVGVQDNFFDLGGYSLLLARIQRRLRERFERELSVLDLFRYPTVESLAQFLGPLREREVSLPPSLVELQPRGSRPPLFLVHPLSGELLLYRYLVSGLGSDQPVYGFQARGFGDGLEPLSRVEDMAGLYVEALLSFHPRGPYLLAGSSFGGHVAFEMARQLRARGDEVALLALLDSPVPGQMVAEADEEDGRGELAIFNFVTGGDPTMPLERMRTLSPEERLELILQRGRETGFFAAAFGIPELRHLVRVVSANQAAMRSYAPDPADVRVDYFHARESEFPGSAWAGLALGGVTVHEIPGGHLSLHFPPHVEEAAARLNGCIERAVRPSAPEMSPASPLLIVPGSGGESAQKRDL